MADNLALGAHDLVPAMDDLLSLARGWHIKRQLRKKNP